MKVGQRIKERRKELKMSADELGKRLGKNRATIYRYENGDIENLPLDILEPIAEALLTTPQFLMGWAEKVEQNPVGVAERHFEMIVDEDLDDIFDDFKALDSAQKQIVKDLIHSLAATKKGV